MFKGMEVIGRGSFSTCYAKRGGSGDKVLILSNDRTKECMANGWFPSSRLFPKVRHVAEHSDGRSIYQMKRYEKPRSLKNSLKPEQYKLYCDLRDLQKTLHSDFDYLSCRYKRVWKFTKAVSESNLPVSVKRNLVSAAEALANYAEDVSFEISPRNVAVTESGNLVLLDVFFFASDVLELREKRAAKRLKLAMDKFFLIR